MRITDTSDLWWKNAVVYCLDVKRFADSDGDGWGDFRGLAGKVDYLADLGVTCLWLMPFYPSPMGDDGYDITDYYAIDPRVGTFGDFVEFMRTAHDRGMRVIADLVPNHTSVEHPWFQSARQGPGSPYHDWYVWSDDPPPTPPTAVAFPGQETSIWQYDETCGRHYLHSFYRFQPDLDVSNPAVQNEIAKIAGFWLELGIGGFRIDAVPSLLETMDEASKARMPDPHEFLRDLRAFLGRRSGESMLLGEVNLPHDQQKDFFGSGDALELSTCFDFITMQNFWLSMARQDASPLAHAVQTRPRVADDGQWATFVRNHDELTLDRLTAGERQEVFRAFGPSKSMQVYGRGLRRRLPPMLDGDQDRIRLAYSLLFSLPGTPTLFYGEEIGMGENLAAEQRLAVRTPMQWTSGRNGGFSTAATADLVAPVVRGRFGPKNVNAEDQRRDPESLHAFIRSLVRVYRECPELGWGEASMLPCEQPSVLAHRCTWEGRSIVLLHNLADRPVTAQVSLPEGRGPVHLAEPLGETRVTTDATGRFEVRLPRYGRLWLRVQA
ncbi:MAG TPA: alpha-amylase family protein [Actinomycetes bacterium]